MTTLVLKGDIERDVAALLIEQLSQLERVDAPLVVDLTESDIDDAVVAAMLVECIRATSDRIGGLEIVRAPQILAHALYRIGILGDSAIRLTEPRLEIATSS